MAGQVGKRGKATDKRPARTRYWAGKHLEHNKVKHLMKSHGMTREDATKYWKEARGNRRMNTSLIGR